MEKSKLHIFKTIDKFGRLSIPKDLREKFHLSNVEFFTLEDEKDEYLCIGGLSKEKEKLNKVEEMIDNTFELTQEQKELIKNIILLE